MTINKYYVLFLLLISSFLLAREPCEEIVEEVHLINNEQNYYYAAYTDAQLVSDYEAMADVLRDLADNFDKLSDLEVAYCDYSCDEEML